MMSKKHFKKKPKELEPLRTLKNIFAIIEKGAYYPIGDYLNPNWTWKWNIFVFDVFIMIISTLICYIFMAYTHRNDLNEVILCICLIFIDVLASQRIILWSFGHQENLKIFDHLFDYTKKHEHESDGLKILLWYYRLLWKLILLLTFTLIMFGMTLASAPIFYYLCTGKMILIYECHIPYLDTQSYVGFGINVIYHAWTTFLVVTGICATTTAVLMMFAQICIEIDILREKLQGQSSMIYNTNDNKKSSKITEELCKLFEAHQNLLEYLNNVEDVLSIQSLSDHIVVFVQACLGLFICLRQFWLPGYVLISAGIFIVFSVNLLGSIIEVKLEKLCMEVYDVPWYLMSVKNQKMFCYFLANTQNTERLTLAGHFPLCLDTFVRLYKTIYSYLMILREMQI